MMDIKKIIVERRYYLLGCCALIIVLMDICFVLYPEWQRVNELTRSMGRYQTQLTALKKQVDARSEQQRVHSVDQPSSDSAMLTMAVLMQRVGLHHVDISRSKKKNIFHLQFSGHYAAVLALLREMRLLRNVFIDDFNIASSTLSDLNGVMDLVVVGRINDIATKLTYSAISSPFCTAGEESIAYSLKLDSSQFRVASMRMLGYLHQAGVNLALIELPNHQVLTAAVGERIGRDRLLISGMTRNKIIFKNKDGRTQQLKMDV